MKTFLTFETSAKILQYHNVIPGEAKNLVLWLCGVAASCHAQRWSKLQRYIRNLVVTQFIDVVAEPALLQRP
ncbi:MAG TPA: hypothetical protein DIS73_03970 [Planctomycetia bacterium]|nr:hypothetical protein [Planctomycetia bacterium]